MMFKLLKVVSLSVMLLLGSVLTSSALTVMWDDPNNSSVKGTTIVWNETGDTDTPYSKTVFGATTVTLTIDNKYFKPGQSYTFWATHHNDVGESANSETVAYLGTVFIPRADNPPVIIYEIPAPPSGVAAI